MTISREPPKPPARIWGNLIRKNVTFCVSSVPLLRRKRKTRYQSFAHRLLIAVHEAQLVVLSQGLWHHARAASRDAGRGDPRVGGIRGESRIRVHPPVRPLDGYRRFRRRRLSLPECWATLGDVAASTRRVA